MKKIIQRSLPINQTYSLIGTFYTPVDESGICCENCGKPISNIAEIIGNNDNIKRYVGIDCADTLAGISGTLNFELYGFQAAKSARSAILKTIKKANEKNIQLHIKIETFLEGEGFYKENGSGWYSINPVNNDGLFRTWKQFPASQWLNYVYPMIKDLATNF